eukprot:g7016.t1
MFRPAQFGLAIVGGGVAGLSLVGTYASLDLPMPQAVSKYLTNLVEEQRARNYKGYRPKRIILLRHGQTHGYSHTCNCQIDGVPVCSSKPEHDRPLTDKGFEQALVAGNELKALVGDEKTRFLVSPYRACKQTFDCVSVPFDPNRCNFREEPRLRNQDLGAWWKDLDGDQIVKKKERVRGEAGNFYYRWPGGESCADVYDRISLLFESLHKERTRPHADNYVLVSHTVTCQMFLMKWFHWDVSTFEKLDKFRTGQFVVMERQADGRYKIANEIFTQRSLARTTTLKKDFKGERDLNVTHVTLQKWGSDVTPRAGRGVYGSEHAKSADRAPSNRAPGEGEKTSDEMELDAIRERQKQLTEAKKAAAAQGQSKEAIQRIDRELEQAEADHSKLRLRWRRGSN